MMMMDMIMDMVMEMMMEMMMMILVMQLEMKAHLSASHSDALLAASACNSLRLKMASMMLILA